jgi:hypothetical protein
MAEIERILGAPERVEPSPLFAHRVMASVRREAALPPPIPFPWRRLAGGLVASGLLAAAAVAVGPTVAPHLPPLALSGSALRAIATGLATTAVSLLGAWVLTRLSYRLVRT